MSIIDIYINLLLISIQRGSSWFTSIVIHAWATDLTFLLLFQYLLMSSCGSHVMSWEFISSSLSSIYQRILLLMLDSRDWRRRASFLINSRSMLRVRRWLCCKRLLDIQNLLCNYLLLIRLCVSRDRKIYWLQLTSSLRCNRVICVSWACQINHYILYTLTAVWKSKFAISQYLSLFKRLRGNSN